MMEATANLDCLCDTKKKSQAANSIIKRHVSTADDTDIGKFVNPLRNIKQNVDAVGGCRYDPSEATIELSMHITSIGINLLCV
jgi:hypothetical protein